MVGVIKMFHFLVQYDEVLRTLKMSTTTLLEKKEAVQLFQHAPVKSANVNDIANIWYWEYLPFTIICSGLRPKLQILQLKRSSTYAGLFLHPYGAPLLDDISDADWYLIQDLSTSLVWARLQLISLGDSKFWTYLLREKWSPMRKQMKETPQKLKRKGNWQKRPSLSRTTLRKVLKER